MEHTIRVPYLCLNSLYVCQTLCDNIISSILCSPKATLLWLLPHFYCSRCWTFSFAPASSDICSNLRGTHWLRSSEHQSELTRDGAAHKHITVPSMYVSASSKCNILKWKELWPFYAIWFDWTLYILIFSWMATYVLTKGCIVIALWLYRGHCGAADF